MEKMLLLALVLLTSSLSAMKRLEIKEEDHKKSSLPGDFEGQSKEDKEESGERPSKRSRRDEDQSSKKATLFNVINDGNLSSIISLLESSPELLDVSDDKRNTILHRAAEKGHLEIVQELAKRFPALIHKTNDTGSTVLHIAARFGKLAVVQWLAENQPQLLKIVSASKMTVLHEAALNGDLAIFSYIAQLCPELVKMTNHQGCSVLYAAAQNERFEIISYIAKTFPDVAHIANNKGKTALYYAAENRNLEMVKYLAKKFPELLTQKAHNEYLPIDIARAQKHREMVEYLGTVMLSPASSVKPSLPIQAQLPSSATSLSSSGGKEKVSSAQSGATALLPVPQPHESSALEERGSTDLSSLVSLHDVLPFMDVRSMIHGQTALHHFLESNEAIIDALLESGADINAPDDKGNTVLMKAIILKNKSLVELLLDLGAHINVRNPYTGKTALMYAAALGLDYISFVTLLIEQGADKTMIDNEGRTFVEYFEPSMRSLVSVILSQKKR